MKKQLLLLAIAALSFSAAKAQIISVSYDDMETWNPDAVNSAVLDPNSGTTNTPGWQCFNLFTSVFTGNSPQSVFEENTIVNSGSHSCKIKSVVLTTTSYNYVKSIVKHDTVGLIMSGTLTATPSIIPGAPFTTRTGSISFAYQYFPQNNAGKPDTASCGVILTQNHVTIGTGALLMNSASSWTTGTVNITYTGSGNPDTIIVVFLSSSNYKPAPGSILYIDGVTVGAPLAVDQMSANSNGVSVYPNPASTEVNFRITGQNAHSIEVYDVTGKKVNTYPVKDNMTSVNTGSYPAGLYFYQVKDTEGNMIKTGKFSVTR